MNTPLIRAGVGALCIGLGITLLLSAAKCTNCGETSPEATADDIAAASAEMTVD